MKKFVFRPQVVLDRTCEEEERLLLHMASIQHELAGKDHEIARTSGERKATLQVMTETQREHFDVEEVYQQRLHLDALDVLLARLHDERAAIQQRLDAARNAVIETMRKRKVLEKLRATHFAAYRKEVEKQELQVMEDAKLPQFARERMEKAM